MYFTLLVNDCPPKIQLSAFVSRRSTFSNEMCITLGHWSPRARWLHSCSCAQDSLLCKQLDTHFYPSIKLMRSIEQIYELSNCSVNKRKVTLNKFANTVITWYIDICQFDAQAHSCR